MKNKANFGEDTMTDEVKQQAEDAYEQAKENLAGDDTNSPFETFVEKQRLAAEEFTKALEELFPAGFREHTRKAGKAFVDSFKVLLDSARSDFEDIVRRTKEEKEEEADTGNTKVKVDIE